ncbi:uncharacterized protein LOC141613853 [Silene latifolia]|uniref:uncharacterized protein LOC141613853 n=1 Tax=Silene latifolia TaxID=37657 RepID=UPI003D786392
MVINSAQKSCNGQRSIPKRTTPSKKSSSDHNNGKNRGPDEEDVLRTKPMHEVHQVTGLSFEDEEDPATNIAWVTQRVKKPDANNDKCVSVILETPVMEGATEDLLEFTNDDIKEEVEYWNQAVYCFVLGSNPPWEVLNGFIHRIWSKYGIDKVYFLPNGIFLVRFKELKDKEAVLSAGYHMFDNKPLIVKPWPVDVNLLKEDVKVVHAWVILHGLPLKFCGKCLPSIAGLVGKYVKKDVATEEKTRLGFARTMVELTVGQKFPGSVKFKDEHGKIVMIKVEYEWKRSICTKYKGMGHEDMLNATVSSSGKKVTTTPNNVQTIQPQETYKAPDDSPIQSAKGSEKFNDHQMVVVENGNPPIQSKTKINAGNVSNISQNLFDGWCVTTNCHTHKGGRVWLIWQPSLFDILILQYNPQLIHVKVTVLAFEQTFYLTMIYAFNAGAERAELWNWLNYFALQCPGPWALAVDFNTVIHPDERMGGHTKQEDMEEFLNCLGNCGMVDILATGAFFTRNNKQDVEHRKHSRLDRFLINQEWLDMFPNMAAHIHPEGLLDHTPCVICNMHLNNGKARSFKYFNMWSSASAFLPTVQEVWKRPVIGTKIFCIVKKLNGLKYSLKALNKDCFSDIENKTNQEMSLMSELGNLTKSRDNFLQQKSKAQWMEEGDSNTAYFHNAIKK